MPQVLLISCRMMLPLPDTLWRPPRDGNGRAESAEGELGLSFCFHGLSCHRWWWPGCWSSEFKTAWKRAGDLTEGPPPGTSFCLSLHSPEPELRELWSLNIKLKSYVSVLLARGTDRPFTGSAETGVKITIVLEDPCDSGIWHELEIVRSRHLSPCGWCGCLRFSQVCGIFPFLAIALFWGNCGADWGGGEWMRQRMNECLREKRSFPEAGCDLLSQNQSSKEVNVVNKS